MLFGEFEREAQANLVANNVEKIFPSGHPEHVAILQQAFAVVSNSAVNLAKLSPEDRQLIALMVALSHRIDDLFDKKQEIIKHRVAVEKLINIINNMRFGGDYIDLNFVNSVYDWLALPDFASMQEEIRTIIQRLQSLDAYTQFYWCFSLAKMVLAGEVGNAAFYYTHVENSESGELQANLISSATDLGAEAQLRSSKFYRRLYFYLVDAVGMLGSAQKYYFPEPGEPDKLERIIATDSSEQGLFLLFPIPGGLKPHHVACNMCVDAIAGTLVYNSNSFEEEMHFAGQPDAHPSLKDYLEFIDDHWRDLADIVKKYPKDEYVLSRLKLTIHSFLVFSRSAHLNEEQVSNIFKSVEKQIKETIANSCFESDEVRNLVLKLLLDLAHLLIPPNLYTSESTEIHQVYLQLTALESAELINKTAGFIIAELRKILGTHDFSLMSLNKYSFGVGEDSDHVKLLHARLWHEKFADLTNQAKDLLDYHMSRYPSF